MINTLQLFFNCYQVSTAQSTATVTPIHETLASTQHRKATAAPAAGKGAGELAFLSSQALSLQCHTPHYITEQGVPKMAIN